MSSHKYSASVVLDLRGTVVEPDEVELLTHPMTAGVILFSRNFETTDQLTQLCSQIKSHNPALFISVDHEGGRVQRFREGFTRVPAMGTIGRVYKEHQRYAMNVAEMSGFVLAAELILCGVDLSYAPVLDLDLGLNDVIGDRSFSSKPDVVADLGVCLMNGLTYGGMKTVGKHFPGHGHVNEDSHHALPVDDRDYERIINTDVFPFRLLIESGMKGVMPAHVIYSQVDPDSPAGFSKRWLQTELREKLGFQGAIFSDDLSMQGAVSAQPTAAGRAKAAIEAGCNLLLVCNDQAAAREVLNALCDIQGLEPYAGVKALMPSVSALGIKRHELEQAQKAVRDFVKFYECEVL
jgi:beta-N-acetylhexosaminidase